MVVVPSSSEWISLRRWLLRPEDQNIITVWQLTVINNPENLNLQQYPCEDVKCRVNIVSLTLFLQTQTIICLPSPAGSGYSFMGLYCVNVLPIIWAVHRYVITFRFWICSYGYSCFFELNTFLWNPYKLHRAVSMRSCLFIQIYTFSSRPTS